MDDETLSRMAIEEIVREMNEARQREMQIPLERKLNPLGKPNKRFLGRTINSMLTHNKRQNEIKRENCRRKLRDLDDRARRRLRNEYFNKEVKERWSRTRSKSGSSRVTVSSSSSRSSSSSDESKKRRKKKKSKSKNKISKSRRRSSQSSTDENQKEQSHRRRYKDYAREEEEEQQQQHQHQQQEQYNQYPMQDYYAQANLHYSNIAAAYNQINQLYHYSSILASAANTNNNAITIPPSTTNPSGRKKSKSKSPILSTSSSPSSTSTSLSISLSSLEEDENGVLTINVSSDNEDSTVKPLKSVLEIVDDSAEALILSASSDSSDSDGNNCINLETESANEDSDSSVAILSCSSVSEKNCEETVPLIAEKLSTSESPKTMIDLTEE